MTITHSSRLIASVAGVAVAAALVAGVLAAPSAKAALSSSQVSAIISLLQSFGADASTIANVQASLTGGTPSTPSTGGTGAACYAWTRSLTVGDSGADVKALQVFLNSSASTQVAASGAGSAGMETMTFGPMTQAAVAKFQTANGISPAAGYFGPVTRAAVAAKCSPSSPTTPTTPSGPLGGGEGQLLINSNLGDVETDVDEGDNDTKVVGAEVEADDSDIMIERVDVDFTVGSGGSANLDDYIQSVSLWLDGEKLAEQDVDEGDEDSSDVFSFRFSGLDGVVREGDKANLYVSVDAVDNVDTGDTDVTIDVDIPTDGIRAVDGAGISDTYVDGSPALDGGFSISTETAGDLDISEGDDNPVGQVVQIDEDDDTLDVLVLEFDVEANNQDLTIDDIPVGLVESGEDAGMDGVVKRAILKKDGETLDTVTIDATTLTSYQVLFDNLDLDIEKDDTATFQVYVDLNDADPTTFATGTTLYATTTGSNGAWDVEDASGNNVTPDGSVSNSGDVLVFHTDSVVIKLVSTSETKTFSGDAAGEADIGEFKIVVDITAVGADMYIDKTVTADPDRDGSDSAGDGFLYATTSDSTTGTTTTAVVSQTSGSTSGDTSTAFKINEGQTERFTLTVTATAAIDGFIGVQLTGINWDTDGDTDSTADNFYNSNLSDFKTDLLSVFFQ